MTRSVTCLVLSWNSRQYLDDCLSALLASDHQDFRVVLIDNASVDGSAQYVSQAFPSVKIIANWTNLGFAAGNNAGLANLESDIAILVNPDVIVSERLVKDISATFEDDERIGVVGCRTYYPGTGRIQHAGGTVTYPRGIADHYGRGQEDEGQFDNLVDVDYVTGAVFAARKTLLDEIGLFDGGYYMYYEEADFCARAARAGYRIVLSRDARAEHVESAQASRESRFYHHQLQRSRWRFLLKHYALADVLVDTIPAERDWLWQAEPIALAAASDAYRQVLMDLPDILERRQAEKLEAISGEETQEIRYQLGQLRKLTLERYWRSPIDLDYLSKLAALETQPFHSGQPLIGAALAKFRELWSRIAVKPFADPLFDQQRELNRVNSSLLIEAVQDGEDEIDQRIVQDHALAEIVEALGEAEKTLARLERRMQSLEHRISEGKRSASPENG